MIRLILALAVTAVGFGLYSPESDAGGLLARIRQNRATRQLRTQDCGVPVQAFNLSIQERLIPQVRVQRHEVFVPLRLQQQIHRVPQLRLQVVPQIGVQRALFGF